MVKIILIMVNLFIISCSSVEKANEEWLHQVDNTLWKDVNDVSHTVKFDSSGNSFVLSDVTSSKFILNNTKSSTCAIYRAEYFIVPPKWYLANIDVEKNKTNLVLFGPFIEENTISKDPTKKTNYTR